MRRVGTTLDGNCGGLPGFLMGLVGQLYNLKQHQLDVWQFATRRVAASATLMLAGTLGQHGCDWWD